MKTRQWLDRYAPLLCGARVAITGATGGLGEAICQHLAYLGAQMVLLCRCADKAQRLTERLQKQYPNIQTEYIPLDLEDTDSVRQAAQALQQRPVQYLIHNAGIYSTPRCITAQGIDNLYLVNFAAPYYFTTLLLPTLRQQKARVILVSSIAQKAANKDSRLQARVYGYAKRHMLSASQQLFERENECSFVAVHPGVTPTGITAHYPKAVRALIKYPMKWIFHSPGKASLNVIAGLFDSVQENSWIGPSRLGIWGFPKCQKYRSICSKERQEIADIARKMVEKLHNGR